MTDSKTRVYLATPYSHKHEVMREAAFTIVNYAMSILIKNHGLHVYSPISHSHAIARDFNLSGDYDFWKAFDESEIMLSDELWVLCEPGWQKSNGVNAEILFAEAHNIPVRYIHRSFMRKMKFEVSDHPIVAQSLKNFGFNSDSNSDSETDLIQAIGLMKNILSEIPRSVPMGLSGARAQLELFIQKHSKE